MATKSAFSLQESLISAISLLVFSFLDLLDFLLCFFYRFLDRILEENPSHCYCQKREEQRNEERTLSETLYGIKRRNVFRELMGFDWLVKRTNERRENGSLRSHRWSDCGCERCVSWQRKGEERLHFVVKEPTQDDKWVLGEEIVDEVGDELGALGDGAGGDAGSSDGEGPFVEEVGVVEVGGGDGLEPEEVAADEGVGGRAEGEGETKQVVEQGAGGDVEDVGEHDVHGVLGAEGAGAEHGEAKLHCEDEGGGDGVKL